MRPLPRHVGIRCLTAVVAALALAAPTTVPASGSPQVPPRCDFNGDGFGDVPVGVPREDFRVGRNAGGVNVLYGTATGVRGEDAQWWTRKNTMSGGANIPGNYFGLRLACGDFDADGLADLAIAGFGVGEVTVLYGTTSHGLGTARAQLWSAVGAFSLVAGDFDGDGADELAIGAPAEDDRRGAVHVLYGGGGGLTEQGRQRWTQASPGVRGRAEPDDACGYDLERGDFDGDTYQDLVWSCREPGDEWEGLTRPIVQQLQGSNAGLVATHTEPVNIPHELHLASGDFNGDGRDDLANMRNVRYGTAKSGLVGGPVRNAPNGHPTAGDFNGDGYADAAWGDPNRREGGTVIVAYGSSIGIDRDNRELWHADRKGVKTRARKGDQFGWAVSATDTDGSGHDDLVIGVRLRDVRRRVNAGAMHILAGSANGITARGDRYLHQGTKGVPNRLEARDGLGSAVAGDGQ